MSTKTNCPTCGSDVKIVSSGLTHHYEPSTNAIVWPSDWTPMAWLKSKNMLIWKETNDLISKSQALSLMRDYGLWLKQRMEK